METTVSAHRSGIRIPDLGCGDGHVAWRAFMGVEDVQYFGIETQCFPIEQSGWRAHACSSGLGYDDEIYRDDAELFGTLKFSQ